MRDLRASGPMSHSPSPRTAEPLLDSSDEENLGQSRRDLGLGLDGATQPRDDAVGYASTGERRHQLRSRSPREVTRVANKQKILLAAIALIISLVTFVVQTETAVYIQKDLGWNKAYCMLYMTHGSWTFLWPLQILFLKLRKPSVPWRNFIHSHMHLVKTTAQMTQFNTNRVSTAQSMTNPAPHFIKQIAIIATALTFAGSSWYVAVNMTTPSDLTAIYNCSAFFAYAFSIPLLHEKVRSGKVISVAIAILGVMIVAYGDGKGAEEVGGTNRVLGNLIIGLGSVLYGFYEVLYKKLACPPEATSPGRSVIFANAVGTGIGFFTLSVLWIPLPILHWTGIEPFVMPRGETAYMMAISVLSNVLFSGSFLVLISLTSPVLSSVAALLTIFLVAITDWAVTGVPLTFAAVSGGLLIIGAFGVLSWDTWKELKEEEEKRLKKGDDVDDVVDDEESVDGERGRTEERGRLLRAEGV